MKSTMTIRNLLSGRRSALVAATALALAIPAGASAATSSSALLACQKSFESQIRSFTNSTIARLSNCTEKVVECKLAQEIDAADPTACLASAANSCSTLPTKVADQQTTRASKIVGKCGLIPLADLEEFVAGLGFFNVVSACGAGTVAQLVDCVVADSRCALERSVFRLDPRAQDSLSDPAINIAGSFPCVAP
ncbi:MAG TPA: hypothetical protein VFD92_15665 [Candidatus Binatia bacterium]|nr:hypothetical protein [Candidatus Binatia bacterium]